MTPTIATYVFILYARARNAERLIQTLSKTLRVPTGWGTIPITLVTTIATYFRSNPKELGWLVQNLVDSHRRNLQAALVYGPGEHPIDLMEAFK
jgi:hypothetical protein